MQNDTDHHVGLSRGVSMLNNRLSIIRARVWNHSQVQLSHKTQTNVGNITFVSINSIGYGIGKCKIGNDWNYQSASRSVYIAAATETTTKKKSADNGNFCGRESRMEHVCAILTVSLLSHLTKTPCVQRRRLHHH